MFYGLDIVCLHSHSYTQCLSIYTHTAKMMQLCHNSRLHWDDIHGHVYPERIRVLVDHRVWVVGTGRKRLEGNKNVLIFVFDVFCFCVHMYEVTYRLGSPPFLVNSHLKVKGISRKTTSGVCDDETYGHLQYWVGTLIRLNWPVTGISPSGISLIRSDDLQGKLCFFTSEQLTFPT